jgi:hypothetical protein
MTVVTTGVNRPRYLSERDGHGVVLENKGHSVREQQDDGSDDRGEEPEIPLIIIRSNGSSVREKQPWCRRVTVIVMVQRAAG